MSGVRFPPTPPKRPCKKLQGLFLCLIFVDTFLFKLLLSANSHYFFVVFFVVCDNVFNYIIFVLGIEGNVISGFAVCLVSYKELSDFWVLGFAVL